MSFIKSPFFGELQESEIIAIKVADNRAETQSARFCPLIWRALKLCYDDIPEDLVNAYPNSHEIVDLYTHDLAKIPGWCKYARAVLKYNFGIIPNNVNNFENSYVIEKSNDIAKIANSV